MNKIYEFTLHPSGYDPDKPRFYVIGAGTLEDGIAIIEDMNKQFVKWAEDPVYDRDKLFDLRIPSVATPIRFWEGGDLFASGGPFGEQYGKELFENYYYTMDNKWEIDE